MAKQLVFIVEGDCEEYLINKKVIPYLYLHLPPGKAWTMNAQKIITNRSAHIRGGNVSYSYLKNDIERTSKQNNGDVLITTFLDFFRLPTDFPGYKTGDINQIEDAVRKDNPDIDLLPYIQKYEFETLLFADREALAIVIDDPKALKKVDEILSEYTDIEDINSSPEKAPSKRLMKIFDYNKTADSSIILDFLDMQTILVKCQRFKSWIGTLVERINQ